MKNLKIVKISKVTVTSTLQPLDKTMSISETEKLFGDGFNTLIIYFNYPL